GSVYLVARLIKAMMVPRDDLTWWQSPVTVGAALWTGLLPLFIHNMNGLETGLYSLLLLSATLCYHRLLTRSTQTKEVILIGALFGLVILARLDGIVIVSAILLLYIARSRWRK